MKDVIRMVAIPETLAFLSLLSFAALWVRAIRKTWKKGKDKWGLYKHGSDRIPDVINWALRYCLRRGFIVIEARNSEHFIQFRKYILRNGEIGLELGFTDASWSKAHFPKLRETLTANGIPFRETRETYDDFVTLIQVDCGQDIDRATYLARLCFFDLFGLSEDTLFRSSPTNYSELHDDVDDPDYANPVGFRNWWSALRGREQEKGRPDPAPVLMSVAITAGWLICYVTLWVFWFFAGHTPPDWHWDVGSIQLAGNHSTLMLLLIYCAMLFGCWRTNRRLFQTLRPKPRTLLHRIGAAVAIFGLPLAVVAAWFGL